MEVLMIPVHAKEQHVDDVIREAILNAKTTVKSEPGCRRYDVIQDENDPTKLGLCQIYNDMGAFYEHLSLPHYQGFSQTTKNWTAAPPQYAKYRPVFPVGDACWDSQRASAVEDEAFNGGLFVIHAPLKIKEDHVSDFIDSLRRDAIGSVNEEQGCLRFDIYQNQEDRSTLYLYEVYVNKAAFEYHRGTPHIKRWVEEVKDWYAPGFSLADNKDKVVGTNVWPPDNWNWSSGKPNR